VGVWKVLRSDPRGMNADPDVLSGTSAGALNSYLIAAGLEPDQVLQFWLDLAYRPPVRANELFFSSLLDAVGKLMLREPGRPFSRRRRELRIFTSLFRKHRVLSASGLEALFLEFFLTARFDSVSDVLDNIATTHLFDATPLRDRLEKAVRGRRRKTGIKVAINVIDVRTGGVVRIVNHPPKKAPRSSVRHYRVEPEITADMVLASASIPLLFNPVRLDDQMLWDGGVLVNTPMAPAVALGAKRIVPVLVTPRVKGNTDPLSNFGSAVERLADSFLENAYSSDRKLLLDRNALAERVDDPDLRIVELFKAIRPESSRTFNAGSYLYFERDALIAMFEAGQRAARRWLAEGPPVDHRGEDG
jgi:predicted acylesterase/phospholipase RssA